MPTVKLPCIARNTPVIRTAVLQIEADKRRQQSEELVHALEADLTGIDARLITRPLFKKAVLRAARLDRFDHLDAGDGRSGELARVAHLHAGEVDPLF